MTKYIAYFLLLALVPVIIMTGKVEGDISYKYAKTTWGDSVYFFIINGKELEVSRRNYYLYNSGEYFKQGIME